MKAKENAWNVPNLLSAYRLVALPFIIYVLLNYERQVFLVLLIISLVTDILDGVIARRFNLQTEFGAKLDSWADTGTYLVAVAGMWVFERGFVVENKNILLAVFVLYLIPQVVSLIKFRRTPSLHLYSAKIAAYVQGIFLLVFFTWGMTGVFFFFVVMISSIAYLEELIVLLILPELRSNARSIFSVLKSKSGDKA